MNKSIASPVGRKNQKKVRCFMDYFALGLRKCWGEETPPQTKITAGTLAHAQQHDKQPQHQLMPSQHSRSQA